MTNQQIQNILTQLRKDDVYIISTTAYNMFPEGDNPYQSQYFKLYNELIVKRLLPHFDINDLSNDLTLFSCFEYNKKEHTWYAEFLQPKINVPVNNILKLNR